MGSQDSPGGNSDRGSQGTQLDKGLRVVRALIAVLFLLLLGAILYASTQENMFQSFPGRNIWVQVTLIDLYIGFVLMGIWVVYRERRLVGSIPWVISFMLLGNLSVFAYVFWALRGVRGRKDLDHFFHGHRATASMPSHRGDTP